MAPRRIYPRTYECNLIWKKRISADVIKLRTLRWNPPGFRQYPKSNEVGKTLRDCKGRVHLKIEAKMGVMLLEATEYLGWLTVTRNQQSCMGHVLPQSLRGNPHTCLHLGFRLLAFATVREYIFIVLS